MVRDQRACLMSRRSFCWTLAGVFVTPGIAIAQAANKVRRIGVLEGGEIGPEWLRRRAEPLRELGWVEGQNLHVERRYGNGRYDNGRLEELQALADELIRAKVEIIVTGGTPATLAAKRATTTIPIVFSASDPVLVGIVASLARPGGNLTGVSLAGPEVDAKRVSVLKELLPGLQRLGVLFDGGNFYNQAANRQFEQVCRSLGITPITLDIGAAGEIEGAIAQLVPQRVQALFLRYDPLVGYRADEIVKAATRHGLPTLAEDAAIVQGGGALIAYAPTWAEWFRRRAEYIDKILRGARPADLPVQQPTKFALVINLKIARALGLTIPKELLLRADEVIQ